MPIDPTIRPERDEDHVAIADVITAAFAGKPYADGDEAEVVERLRRAGALAVSLVAELDGALVGQVAFSPAQESSGAQGWYGLGPVAVSPEHQGAGIGSKLIRAGLERTWSATPATTRALGSNSRPRIVRTASPRSTFK